MSKILDKDFRNELYKNLCDAGYSKGEATSIVSVKYRDALKDKLIFNLKEQVSNIEEDRYVNIINLEEFTASLGELTKIQEFFKKKEE